MKLGTRNKLLLLTALLAVALVVSGCGAEQVVVTRIVKETVIQEREVEVTAEVTREVTVSVQSAESKDPQTTGTETSPAEAATATTEAEDLRTPVNTLTRTATQDDTPFNLTLSRVLTHTREQLMDYYQSTYVAVFSVPDSGWYEVLFEIAASSSNWQTVPECAYRAQVVAIDTGGYERSASTIYFVDHTEQQKSLPPGATQRLWAKTSIPDNQKPDLIRLSLCGEPVEFSVDKATPVDFAKPYHHPELPLLPSEMVVEIPDTARVVFDLGAMTMEQGGTLLVPVTLENTGGYDLNMGRYFDWSEIVSISGFASNGSTIAPSPKAEFPRITPGHSASSTMTLATAYQEHYPGIDPETLSVTWIWITMTFFGQETLGPYQHTCQAP
jgi:hypothetical protein